MPNAKGSAADKAAIIALAVEQARGASKISRSRKTGVTRIESKLYTGTLILQWDKEGRFIYGTGSTFNGKKVRNVAEALRFIAESTHATSR